ncbi:MAG: hypothetical protein M1816_007180 [Peltula sp. TS41687]|nr:MAG: hypothetical protein M1816_007180 [Peltula sp. TS41687]
MVLIRSLPTLLGHVNTSSSGGVTFTNLKALIDGTLAVVARPDSHDEARPAQIHRTSPGIAQLVHRDPRAVREILEPTAQDPDKCGFRGARARSSGSPDSDKIEDDGDECDKEDDIDCESETSDLPSLADIFLRSDSGFKGSDGPSCKAFALRAPFDRTGKDYCHESDREDSGSPAATTATDVRHGSSQDNPIVLDDDQPINTHDAACSDHKPTLRVAEPTPPSGPSPTLSRGFTESGTDDEKDGLDSPTKNTTSNHTGDEKGASNKSHMDDNIHTRTLTRDGGGNECSDNGSVMDSDAPASVGQIHDVFAEYEETFRLRKSKQKAAHSALPGCTERETTVGPLPRQVLQEKPRVATDDDATDVEQAAEAAGDDIARLSKREIGSASIFQPRQEIDGLETKAGKVRSQGVHTLAGDRSENTGAFLQHPLSSSPMTTEVALGPESGAAQGPPYRKRSRRAVAGVDGRVAEVEDVYLGEDGSIQCVVSWKSSLVAMDSLVTGELRQRCEQLFGQSGRREAVVGGQRRRSDVQVARGASVVKRAQRWVVECLCKHKNLDHGKDRPRDYTKPW